ncbi:MAG: hypothetical protein HY079_07860 [Elusimicrobia bacterium]|nr:hypothetical protein [Elusimicrobiota bacterium]
MMKLMSAVMPTCREVTRALASEEDASFLRRMTIGLHLSMCEHCSRFARQLRLISRSLREVWAPVQPAGLEELKRRVLARLRAP